MEFIKKYLTEPIILFIFIGILVLTNIATVSYFLLFSHDEKSIVCPECPKYSEIANAAELPEEKIEIVKIKVDIKGYVKKPGVYELESGAIINDLIKLAGGLKSGGSTDNLNLSKKLKDEDMVKVYSKTELKKLNDESNTSVTNTTSSNNNSSTTSIDNSSNENKKVSLNNATKEELMTLSGIGESKADLIIEYRKTNPFKNIEEIMNVSGIGESLYEKIKNFITI